MANACTKFKAVLAVAGLNDECVVQEKLVYKKM